MCLENDPCSSSLNGYQQSRALKVRGKVVTELRAWRRVVVVCGWIEKAMYWISGRSALPYLDPAEM